MTLKYLPFGAALCVAATLTHAQEFKVGDLTIDHPFAYETPRGAMAGGGYLTVTNSGEVDDRLIGVRADFPKVELHTTEESDGIARMMHVEAAVVPAGGTISLEPGGLHVMFMGLGGDPFEVGEQVPATLVFETAGEIEVIFNIEARGASDAPKMDHSEQSGHGATN